MKKFNILYGKEIPLNENINNSFFLYHTIFINNSSENINPISFCSNSNISAVLYFINSDSLTLEIYENIINIKTQEINFNLKRKIKLSTISLKYNNNSNEDIQMYFLGEKYILIENILKRSIILDHQTGDYTTILLKGKKEKNEIKIYNPIQNSCDDLFKDDSLDSNKNKNLGKIISSNIDNIINKKVKNKLNSKKNNNDSFDSNSSISGESLNKSNASN